MEPLFNEMPVTAFLDALQAYNTNAGEIDRLDPLRDFTEALSDYYYKGWVSPSKDPSLLGNGYSLDPLQTFEEVLSIPPNTYLTMLSSYSSQDAGFAWQIEEVESQSNLSLNLSSRNYSAGNYQDVDTDVPKGPMILGPSFIVGARGLLKVTLINLSTSANYVQLFIETAVPTTNATMQRVAVEKA